MDNFETIGIKDIQPAIYNPRKISNEDYNKLSNSISEFGVISPIILNMKNNHIIGGHQRYDVLLDEYEATGEYEELYLIRIGDIGWVFPSTDLSVGDLSTEKAMNLALNKISGDWDLPKLENLLIDLDVEDFNLDLTGFDSMDLKEFNIDLKTNIKLESPQEKLQKELEKEEVIREQNRKEYQEQHQQNNNISTEENTTVYGEERKIEEDEEIPSIEDIITDIEYGDLFQLGNHRLLCGDAIKTEDVEILMDGVKADTVFTDPPYDLTECEYDDNVKNFSENANVFIMNDDVNAVRYLRKSELEFIEFIIGDFIFTIPRRNRPYLQHIIMTHEINGDAHHWRNELKKGLRSIIKMKYRGTLKDDFTPHKHQKSIDFVKSVLEYTAVENVLDLFGGSGTTLIACEELGLNCYMIELEPRCVQLIIDRYENLTGEKAVKLN